MLYHWCSRLLSWVIFFSCIAYDCPEDVLAQQPLGVALQHLFGLAHTSWLMQIWSAESHACDCSRSRRPCENKQFGLYTCSPSFVVSRSEEDSTKHPITTLLWVHWTPSFVTLSQLMPSLGNHQLAHLPVNHLPKRGKSTWTPHQPVASTAELSCRQNSSPLAVRLKM